MYKDDRGGVVIYMGSVHSHEASPLKSAYVTAKHGLLGLPACWRRKARSTTCARTSCPGFVRTPLVDKQIPEQAKGRDQRRGSGEEGDARQYGRRRVHDRQDVAQTVLFLSAFPSAALTGQSFIVSHGWFMQ